MLFPELAVPPEEDAEATLIRPDAPQRAPTKAKVLTMMSKAPVAGLSGEDPVFTTPRPLVTPSVERALAAPTDDDLMPTLIEKGPTAAELGLLDDDLPVQTEQVRVFGGVSSTAPGMRDRGPRRQIDEDANEGIDADAVTTETRIPLHVSAKTPGPRPHRVSTGASRRVVSLEQTDENSAPTPRKPK